MNNNVRNSNIDQKQLEAIKNHSEIQHALQITLRNTNNFIAQDDWLTKLAISKITNKPLRIKLGLDPTAPDIHLGHTVVLNKLRELQNLGHHIIFLIGDFTTLIGDPSGRNTTRPPLTEQQIEQNAQTYYQQASLILDPEKTEVTYNSKWLEQLGTRGLIKLAAKYPVARMMERDDFEKRYKSGVSISIHEFLYPLLQGYDSVALQADLELGGTDQTFNLLMGRTLQQEYGQTAQCVLTMPLLVGLDGVDKMSKSKNNYIGITENANSMYAKTMSISDELMWDWYNLLSYKTEQEIAKFKQQVAQGLNPKHLKVALAKEITARFHSASAAEAAEQDFINRSKGGIPEDITQLNLTGAPIGVAQLLKQAGLTSSNSEANRLIDGNGVKINSQPITDKGLKLEAGQYILQVGKRKFAKVNLT